jgi:DNA repair exonuclease SbcCD ATPase subunit
MQHDIQGIFNQIKEKKEQLKDLKSVCKDLMDSSEEYRDIEEQMKVLREKKKKIISMINEQCASEITKIEDLKIDIESDQEMLNDMAITKYSKGESIEITDKYENTYEPIFSVKFKKSN